MSILIKGIDIPEKGYVDVRLFSDGRATTQTGDHPFFKEMEIIEIQQNGRQIDSDVIEVVRCKDCKHRPIQTEEGKTYGLTVASPDGLCPFICPDGWYSRIPWDGWFCSFGEKKE